jgi:hypothetical protein
MSPQEPAVYSGLKLLPAALEVLELAGIGEPVVVVEQVRHEGRDRSWTEPSATIDWARAQDARRSTSELTLVAVARSLLDGEPVDLSELSHLGPQTGRRLIGALAAAWDEA